MIKMHLRIKLNDIISQCVISCYRRFKTALTFLKRCEMMKKEVRKMCKASTVLDTIKKTKGKGGMTSAQIKLAEAQSEDMADMKREIQDLKSDVNDVKKEVGDVKVQLAEIKGNLNIILESVKVKQKLIDNKYFWIFLIVFICVFAGVTHLPEILKVFGG